jgi:hypothetical protein
MAFQTNGTTVVSDGTTAPITVNSVTVTTTNSGTVGVTMSGPTSYTSGFQGATYGFAGGGRASTPSGGTNIIVRFPFSSENAQTSVGTTTNPFGYAGIGVSSATFGYNTGDDTDGNVKKWPFSAPFASSTLVGSSTVGGSNRHSNNASIPNSKGYGVGGGSNPQNVIQKFPFASDTNATTIGYLSFGTRDFASSNSDVSGYSTGGYNNYVGGSYFNRIEKFPFATDGNSVGTASIRVRTRESNGAASPTSGYHFGGVSTAGIERYPFSSDIDSVAVGRLAGTFANQLRSSGVSCSPTNAYIHGGNDGAAPTYRTTLEKITFASDNTSTVIPALALPVASRAGGGWQV